MFSYSYFSCIKPPADSVRPPPPCFWLFFTIYFNWLCICMSANVGKAINKTLLCSVTWRPNLGVERKVKRNQHGKNLKPLSCQIYPATTYSLASISWRSSCFLGPVIQPGTRLWRVTAHNPSAQRQWAEGYTLTCISIQCTCNVHWLQMQLLKWWESCVFCCHGCSFVYSVGEEEDKFPPRKN